MKYKNIINPKYESLKNFVAEIPEKFDKEGMLIYDSRNTVRVFKQSDGTKVVVKRYHRSPFPQRFDYTFRRPSKPKRAYNYGLKLQELGINTPTPIACIEEYKWGLYSRGYIITEFCPDPDLRLLRDEPEGHDGLINALARFLVKMHEKGFLHGDTNLSNFLYHEDIKSPGGYFITTIDINRSLFVDKPSKEVCIRNLMRLTHVRPTLTKIITKYAELRGWDVDWAIKFVIQKLDNFEKRMELKKKLKKK